jgi:hypothetical protein
MAKIRFWKWQHTDEFGMPCATRIPISGVDRERSEHLEQNAWSLETRNLSQSPTELKQDALPK